MPNILIYDKATNRGVSYQYSVPEYKYAGRDDVLEMPDVQALLDAAVPVQLWVVDGTLVRERTPEEVAADEAAAIAAQLAAENAAIDSARIADLETKSGTAVLNADKLKPII